MYTKTATSMDLPILSILMPSLNVASYIRECVESVCNQTFKALEILCIDAGSTDGTREILQEMAEKDSRIRIIDSDRKSYGYQMNLGLKAARGQYIGIVETDDYIDSDMYESLHEAAEKYNVEVVKANYYNHKNGTDEFYELLAGLPYERVIHPRDHLSLLTRRASIWSGLYKKKFLEQNGISFLETPGASYQDTSYILKVWIAAEHVCLIKKAFLHYRLDNPNSSVNSRDKVFFVRDELSAVFEYLNSKPEKKKVYEKIIWDCEANIYEWNYNRLTDEMKYVFLTGVQQRYQEGLKNGRYDRRYIRWAVWKMVNQVAENPMLFLKYKLASENYNKQAGDNGIAEPSHRQTQKWKYKEKLLLIPQAMIDVINYTKNYGIAYCIQVIKKKIK